MAQLEATVPLIASHSAFVSSRVLPPQEFCPLQLCFWPCATPAQEPWPLHEFPSLHMTLPTDAGDWASGEALQPAMARATLAARVAPIVLLICFIWSLFLDTPVHLLPGSPPLRGASRLVSLFFPSRG